MLRRRLAFVPKERRAQGGEVVDRPLPARFETSWIDRLVKLGYDLLDVRARMPIAKPMKQGDLCPGYWWSEQMKYYWLLFSNTDRFDYKTNYLSTEGNVFVGLK